MRPDWIGYLSSNLQHHRKWCVFWYNQWCKEEIGKEEIGDLISLVDISIFIFFQTLSNVTQRYLFFPPQIELDIMPDKAWSTPDMFVPPGYHMGASISGIEKPEEEHGDVPYTYAPNSGVGYVMMNGCWGTNYTASDPCYNAKWTSSVCQVC